MLFVYYCCLGKGCVFSYDPVGSYERETYRAAGSSASMLQPLLDNQVQPAPCIDQIYTAIPLQQIGFKNQTGVVKEPITREKAISLVKDVFISAAERDIYTGDGLQIHVISADGIETELLPLRRD